MWTFHPRLNHFRMEGAWKSFINVIIMSYESTVAIHNHVAMWHSQNVALVMMSDNNNVMSYTYVYMTKRKVFFIARRFLKNFAFLESRKLVVEKRIWEWIAAFFIVFCVCYIIFMGVVTLPLHQLYPQTFIITHIKKWSKFKYTTHSHCYQALSL